MAGQTAASTSASGRRRDFDFSDEDFDELRSIVKRITGINLTDSRRELVYGRVSRRLRALGMDSFRDYRAMIRSGEGRREVVEFCNAITTNLTAFYREPHHFDYLAEKILRPLAASANASRRVRIWSAGCSTGEEAYSIAMTIAESIRDLASWDIRILATDLDSDVLKKASDGVYTEDRLRKMNARLRARYFSKSRRNDTSVYTIAPQLRAMVTFRQLNLMHALPMRGPLDVIFCRNTIIYFDKETQKTLFRKMAVLQRPGDRLFLGHSESLFSVSDAWTLIGRTIYRRNET